MTLPKNPVPSIHYKGGNKKKKKNKSKKLKKNKKNKSKIKKTIVKTYTSYF